MTISSNEAIARMTVSRQGLSARNTSNYQRSKCTSRCLLWANSGHRALLLPTDRAGAHRFYVVELPRLVEIGLLRSVEAEVRKPPFARNGLDPVLRLRRLGRTEIDVYRAVGICRQVASRRRIGCALIGNHRPTCGVVVERDRPELDYGHIGRHADAVSLAAFKPVAVLVLRRLQVGLSEVQDAALHADGVADRLVEPRASFVDLRVVVVVLTEFDH